MKKRPRGGALIPAGQVQQAEEVPENEAKAGEYIHVGSIGLGELDDAHTDHRAPETLRGKHELIDLDQVNIDWVMRRLVAEANDFGTRTRQSGRLKALELIGEYLGMFNKQPGDEGPTPEQPGAHLTREEKLERAQQLLKKAADAQKAKKAPANG